MPAVMVAADLEHHDHDELASGLKNLLKAREIFRHPDLGLTVRFDLDSTGELQMVVEGEEPDALAFVSRCKDEGVRIKAVREDDETHFRLG